jgi:copper chaperone CopZ
VFGRRRTGGSAPQIGNSPVKVIAATLVVVALGAVWFRIATTPPESSTKCRFCGVPEWQPPPISSKPPLPDGARLKRVNLKIDGVHCPRCVQPITTLLNATPGVARVKIRFELSRAIVDFAPEQTNAEALLDALEARGYEAMTWTMGQWVDELPAEATKTW